MDNEFVFGVATAAFQIEGGANEGGKTPSIWDTYCQIPGRVLNGDNGLVACDHYHRYKDDIKLMNDLGVQSYRFSIAWSRIFPRKDEYNPEGMQFYKNIIEELKKYNMSAMITLYHWDLPQWLEDEGGWLNRQTSYYFDTFAKKCFEELDKDTKFWCTLNEPYCSSFTSYYEGRHAPGHKNIAEAVIASHHLLLGHGLAMKSYREMNGKNQIGIVLNQTPAFPETNSYADKIASNNKNGNINRWFLDALYKGEYPIDMVNLYAGQSSMNFDFIKEHDFDLIGVPMDYLGINYYFGMTVAFDQTNIEKARKSLFTNLKTTDMGWDIDANEFKNHIKYIRDNYTDIPIYITENGSAWKDVVDTDGKVHDVDRILYLESHLKAVEEMNKENMNVKGYYCWSFLDNFEWAWGYSKRFGIVYVDYETQERIPKDSFYAYQKYIKNFKKQ